MEAENKSETQIIEEKVDRYNYDGFFHYLVTRSDEIRLILCQRMVTGKKLVETKIEKSALYGNVFDGKKYVLDIVARDEDGNLYNIEMQCYTIDENELKRFQTYGFRLVDLQVKKGEDYEKVKPLKQMIINVGDPIKGLNKYMHRFVLYDKKNDVVFPYALYEIYIVQLHYLIMENIEFNVFDELMYLFKNDEAYDKIEPDKSVQEAMSMHDEYMSSAERLAAIERERDEMTIRARRKAEMEKAMAEAREIGLSEGLIEGKAQGLQQGIEQGLQQGIEQGLQQGIEQGLQQGIEQGLQQGITQGAAQKSIDILMVLLKQRLETLSDELEEYIYTCNLEKIDVLTANIFDIHSEEDIRKLIE